MRASESLVERYLEGRIPPEELEQLLAGEGASELKELHEVGALFGTAFVAPGLDEALERVRSEPLPPAPLPDPAELPAGDEDPAELDAIGRLVASARAPAGGLDAVLHGVVETHSDALRTCEEAATPDEARGELIRFPEGAATRSSDPAQSGWVLAAGLDELELLEDEEDLAEPGPDGAAP